MTLLERLSACRMREDAAKKVSQQPEAAGLLQKLLHEVLQSDSEGANSRSREPSVCSSQAGSGEGSAREGGLLMQPPPDETGLDDPIGAASLLCLFASHLLVRLPVYVDLVRKACQSMYALMQQSASSL